VWRSLQYRHLLDPPTHHHCGQKERAETKFLKLSKAIAGTLLLFDLGYFSYDIFTRIDQFGGFFISRLKKNVNPKIVFDRHTGPGLTRNLKGMKCKDAVVGLDRNVLDVDVEVVFRRKRRATKKDSRKTVQIKHRFRLVGVRHPESGTFHFYLTNVGPQLMTPEQIRVAYSGRWMVELLFAELKGACNMRQMPSKRPEVVHALILACAIRLMVSRVALMCLRRRFHTAFSKHCQGDMLEFVDQMLVRRSSTKRFMTIWAGSSLLFLPEVLRCAGVGWNSASLEMMLAASMLDPNRCRDMLFERLCCA
jgi:putative transposase